MENEVEKRLKKLKVPVTPITLEVGRQALQNEGKITIETLMIEFLKADPLYSQRHMARTLNRSPSIIHKHWKRIEEQYKDSKEIIFLSPEEKAKRFHKNRLKVLADNIYQQIELDPKVGMVELAKKLSIDIVTLERNIKKMGGLTKIYRNLEILIWIRKVLPEGFWKNPHNRELFLVWFTCTTGIMPHPEKNCAFIIEDGRKRVRTIRSLLDEYSKTPLYNKFRMVLEKGFKKKNAKLLCGWRKAMNSQQMILYQFIRKSFKAGSFPRNKLGLWIRGNNATNNALLNCNLSVQLKDLCWIQLLKHKGEGKNKKYWVNPEYLGINLNYNTSKT